MSSKPPKFQGAIGATNDNKLDSDFYYPSNVIVLSAFVCRLIIFMLCLRFFAL